MDSCLLAVDNVNKCRLQASTADKETVNVSLLGQLLAVLLRDTATVQDTGLLRRLGRDFLLEPLAESGVDFLCLLGGSNLAGADGPDIHLVDIRHLFQIVHIPNGLVGNDNLAPVLDLVCNSLELLGNNVDCLTGLTLLEALAAAQNHTETAVNSRLCLARNKVVIFL